jgi:RHS repeat-associated protein
LEELVGGQVMRQYTYGNAIVSQRQRAGGTWAASFYTTDGMGSVRQLTDQSGAVTDTYTYDAFGKLLSQTGSTPNAYLYRGERFDADLGLYHLRARSYDANRGRFTTMDPFPGFVDEPTSLHKYLYANADPVNFIDPLGLSTLAEYGALVKRIALRTVAALRTLGRAIACVFLYVASWLAAYVGYWAWAIVRRIAQRMRLGFCVCKITKVTPGYQRPTPADNRGKGKDFENFLADLFFGLGFDVGTQTGVNTPRGMRWIDIDLRWGNWTGGIESKVGDSPYTKAQQWKDRWMNRNGKYPTRLIRFPQWRCRR